jgi:hypothetical protein
MSDGIRTSAITQTSAGHRRDTENEQHQHQLHAAYGLLTLASQPLSQHKIERSQVLMPWASQLSPSLVTA